MANWNERLHPREKRGTPDGGQFTFKSGPASGLTSTRGRRERTLTEYRSAMAADPNASFYSGKNGVPTGWRFVANTQDKAAAEAKAAKIPGAAVVRHLTETLGGGRHGGGIPVVDWLVVEPDPGMDHPGNYRPFGYDTAWDLQGRPYNKAGKKR